MELLFNIVAVAASIAEAAISVALIIKESKINTEKDLWEVIDDQ